MRWIYKVHLGGYAVIILLLLITFTLGCSTPQVGTTEGPGRYAASSGGQVLDTHTGHVCSQRGIYDAVVRTHEARMEDSTYAARAEHHPLPMMQSTFTCWR